MVCTANLCAETRPGHAGSAGFGHKGMGRTGQLGPVGVGGKAVFLPARSPEVLDVPWHLLCGAENLEEQSHEDVGRMKADGLKPLGHVGNHPPQHHSCLQKTKQPEAALSAEVSVWRGPRGDSGGAPGLLPLSLPPAQLWALRHGAAGQGGHGGLLERWLEGEQWPAPETHSQGKDGLVVPSAEEYAVLWPVLHHREQGWKHLLHCSSRRANGSPHQRGASVGAELCVSTVPRAATWGRVTEPWCPEGLAGSVAAGSGSGGARGSQSSPPVRQTPLDRLSRVMGPTGPSALSSRGSCAPYLSHDGAQRRRLITR